MDYKEKSKILLDEQRFPYIGMSLEERNYFLNIIRNCKDICDTRHSVDGQTKCELVQLSLKKSGSVVNADGSLSIGNENRTIEADIYFEKNGIIVDMLITRLCVEVEHKTYRVLDQFKLKNNKLLRTSSYNYDMKSINTNVDNDEIRSNLKR